MRRHRTPRRLVGVLAAATAVFVGSIVAGPGMARASACDAAWVGPAGSGDLSGAWSDAANWSTGAVPTADDDVCLNAGGLYTVAVTDDAAVHGLTVGDGSNSPTLQLVGVTLDLAADSTVAPGATLQLTGNIGEDDVVAIAPGATLTNAGTLDVEQGAVAGRRTVDGGFDNEGTVLVAPNDWPAALALVLTGPLANLDGNGTLTGGVWDTYGNLVLPTHVTVNAATVTVHTAASIFGADGYAGGNGFQPQLNLGSITVDGGNLPLSAPLENRGAVNLVGGGRLGAEPGYTQTLAASGPPPTTTVRGVFPYPGGIHSQLHVSANHLTLNAGTLTGDGYIYGSGGVINAGGVVRPDPTLHIEGQYIQSGSGVLDVTVTGPTQATTISTGYPLALGGALRITTASGVTPTPGAAISIATTANDVIGNFATVSAAPASAQRTWQVVPPSTASVTIRSLLVPSLTETLAPAGRVYGTATHVVGRVSAGGAADTNARVRLYRQASGSSTWTPVTSGYTNSAGTVTFAVIPTANCRYLLAALADGTHVSANSASIAVAVHPKITLAVSTTRPRRWTPLSLYGAVSPNHHGQFAILQRVTNGVWTSIASTRLSSASTYTFRLTVHTAQQQLRVVTAPDADHAGGVSGTVVVTPR